MELQMHIDAGNTHETRWEWDASGPSEVKRN